MMPIQQQRRKEHRARISAPAHRRVRQSTGLLGTGFYFNAEQKTSLQIFDM
jgi:hypothetical protein